MRRSRAVAVTRRIGTELRGRHDGRLVITAVVAVHRDHVRPRPGVVGDVCRADDRFGVQHTVSRETPGDRGDRRIRCNQHPVTAGGAHHQFTVRPSQRITDADRPARQRGQRRLGPRIGAAAVPVGAEHVLERPQPQRAGEGVRVQEPGPQQLRWHQVAVVARGPDGCQLPEGRTGHEVRRGRHAPLRGHPPPGQCAVQTLLPLERPTRLAAQLTHAEETLDEPIVFDGLDAPRNRLVQVRLVQIRPLGMRVVTVDPTLEVLQIRRVRGQVPHVGHERRSAQRVAQRRDPVRQDVVPSLPAIESGGRHVPLIGVERADRAVRVEPRIELHRCVGNVAIAQVGQRRIESVGDRASTFCPVPVGRTVVGPVRDLRPDRVDPAWQASGRRPAPQDLGPSVQALAGVGAGDHRELGPESLRNRFQIAVPTAAHTVRDRCRVGRHRDDLLVELIERRQHQRSRIGHHHQRLHDRRAERPPHPVLHVRTRRGRQRELHVLVPERARVGRHSAVAASDRAERGPGDARMLEGTGGEVVLDPRWRTQREDQDRLVLVRAHRCIQAGESVRSPDGRPRRRSPGPQIVDPADRRTVAECHRPPGTLQHSRAEPILMAGIRDPHARDADPSGQPTRRDVIDRARRSVTHRRSLPRRPIRRPPIPWSMADLPFCSPDPRHHAGHHA